MTENCDTLWSNLSAMWCKVQMTYYYFDFEQLSFEIIITYISRVRIMWLCSGSLNPHFRFNFLLPTKCHTKAIIAGYHSKTKKKLYIVTISIELVKFNFPKKYFSPSLRTAHFRTKLIFFAFRNFSHWKCFFF